MFATSAGLILSNLLASLVHTWNLQLTISGYLVEIGQATLASSNGAAVAAGSSYQSPKAAPLTLEIQQHQSFQTVLALLSKESFQRLGLMKLFPWMGRIAPVYW